MTLLVEDLETSRELDSETCHAVTGGLGPVSGPGAGNALGQSAGQIGGNSILGSATSSGVLNTTLNLQLQVAPQINVQTGNLVDLSTITDITEIINSVLG